MGGKKREKGESVVPTYVGTPKQKQPGLDSNWTLSYESNHQRRYAPTKCPLWSGFDCPVSPKYAPCFQQAAIEMIASASDGIPRTINILARTAWIEASRQQQDTINTTHLQRALRLVPAARDKISVPPTS